MPALCLSLAFVALAFPVYGAASGDSLERRLLRTVQIGSPQGVSLAHIKKIADDTNSKYIDAILARSALLVLQQNSQDLSAYEDLLDSVLNNLVTESNAFPPLSALPQFRGKETVLTMVYAMVMSGNQERLTDILEKHLLTGSKFNQAVVLSSLRNLGTQRALGLMQKYAETGPDRNLAQAAIADEDFPVLSELRDRWNLIPPAERTRENLRKIVQAAGCGQRGAMAAYWLGFFSPNVDPNVEEAELQALESFARRNAPDCEMMEHVIGLKSLALRTARSPDYWARLARNTENAWERHQIVINGWARWGRKFAPAALELLKTEPSQYIQWELWDGNLRTREGSIYRPYWNIWIPVNILIPMSFPEYEGIAGKPGMEESDLNVLLRWRESGAQPKDPWVANHMLYNLAELVTGDDTRRWLRLFNTHPQRNQNWWIVANLQDPSALPLLQYWSTLPAPKDQLEMLKGHITQLENRSRSSSSGAKGCCEPTEACLLEQVQRSASDPVTIHSEEEAREWRSGTESTRGITIHFADDSKRAATVRTKNGPEHHWEYLYDCWRNTDAHAQDATPKQ
ncbi:MAG: hypothetical protein WB780_15770 [Candidatus Acidiferrales bacterium]